MPMIERGVGRTGQLGQGQGLLGEATTGLATSKAQMRSNACSLLRAT